MARKTSRTKKWAAKGKKAWGSTKKFMVKHDVAGRGKSFLTKKYEIPTWALLIAGGYVAYSVYKSIKAKAAV